MDPQLDELRQALLDDDSFGAADAAAAQSIVAGASGWDDAEMDAYDNYDAKGRGNR